ncbi:hypothetical protein GQ473_07120 [archaeon]|nr:hypothetical protein [archaeon]
MFVKLLKFFSTKNKKTSHCMEKKTIKNTQLKKNATNFLLNEKNKPYIITFLIITLAVAYSKAIIIIPLFIILAAVSRVSQNIFPFVAGFDFCLFLTVLVGVAYGSFAGAIIGIGSGILGAIIKNSRNVGSKLVFYITMGVVGFLAPYLQLTNILYTGLILTIFYDMIIVFVYFGMIKKCIVNAITFTITHIIFNWWLFHTFGAYFLLIM